MASSLQYGDKYKVMSLGHSVHHDYSMTDHSGTHIMLRTSEEKDLGIFITGNLKQCSVYQSCSQSTLHTRCGQNFRRNFKRLDSEDFLIIYKTYIRPHLEYAIQSWSLYLQSRRIYSVLRMSNGLQLDLYLASRNSPTRKDYARWGSQYWR